MRRSRLSAGVLAAVVAGLTGCPRPRPVAPPPAAVQPKVPEPEPVWGCLCEVEGEGLVWVGADDPSDRRPLVGTRGATRLGQAVISPDHREVAYVPRDGVLDVVEVATGETTQLPEASGAVAWDPVGERLAYVGNDDVHVISLEGETLQLTTTGDVTELGWSPDGQQIAYGRHDPKTYDDRGLWVVSAAGGESRRLVPPTGEVFSAVGPCWSLDGSVIAFVHAWEGAALAFVSPDGARKQTRVIAAYPGPRWLPDSSAVLCGDGFYGEEPTGLFRCPPFGKPEKLLEGRVHDFDASPDGKLAVVIAHGETTGDEDSGDRTLRVLSLATLEEQWSAEFPRCRLGCEWRPDGRQLALEQISTDEKARLDLWTPATGRRLLADGIKRFLGWVRADPAA